LGTEVPDVEEVLLAAGDQLTHRVDALALEAVVGADREVELLDRQGQIGGQGRVGRRGTDVDALGLDVELTGQAEQLDERLTSRSDRVAGLHGRLGLYLEDQPVEVRTLLDSGGLDLVGDSENRRVDRVDRNAA